jgi:hypothetical protein
MTIPLSILGLDKQDVEMLSNRLFPEVNKIFMENLAKAQGYATQDITPLDYQNNPTYKMQKWMANRQQLADHYFDQVQKGQRDPNEFNYKFKSIEQAQKEEPGKHILLEGDSKDLDDINKKIDKLILENKKGQRLEDLSSDEDLSYPLPKLKRQSSMYPLKHQDDEKEDI